MAHGSPISATTLVPLRQGTTEGRTKMRLDSGKIANDGMAGFWMVPSSRILALLGPREL